MPTWPGALGVPFLGLLHAHLAHHHRVDRLEVRGVRGQREMDLPAVGQDAVGRGAEVVLDVARAQHLVDHGLALELGQDGGVGLAHHVGQHVEPAAVRHAEHDLLAAQLGRGADDRLQCRDGARRRRARSAWCRNLTWRNCSKPSVSVRCSRISRFSSAVEVKIPAVALDPRLDPGLLLGVLDVHELDADRAAVGLLQDLMIWRSVAFSRPST